jgi:opacity protein-like surface antigen
MIRRSHWMHTICPVLAVCALVAIPAAASAQMLGVGPKFSMVRGDIATNTPSTRFVGGTLRLNTSKQVGFEGSLDFRTTWDTARTQRLRETPLQGSLLIYPFRSVLSPYALGGMGIYTRTYELVGTSGVISQSAQERKTGMHLGFGGELRVAKHAVAYVDYRYRFVKFGDGSGSNGTTTASANGTTSDLAMRALLATIPGMDLLKFSHQGSMWTGGVAFVF